MGFFSKIMAGLTKTREAVAKQFNSIVKTFRKIDEDLYDELLDMLIMADVGAGPSEEIIDRLRERVKEEKATDSEEVRSMLVSIVADMLSGENEMKLDTRPAVVLVIGVNGAGKTTSIGKMASLYKSQGKKVVLAAADTFRAAAIDQLEVWADRAGVDIVKHQEGSDPAAVIYDAIAAAKARDADIVIADTAGRLHNKKNLMDELGKIARVIRRELPDCDLETLLVLDATTGQNAVNQARDFGAVTDISGIVLTKIDGSAKGGIVIAIKSGLGIPVKFIGVGEQIDDLQFFDPQSFAESLFAGSENEGNAENTEETEEDGK